MAPILVVAGLGGGAGTGAATARVFAQAGYNVALIARKTNGAGLESVVQEIGNDKARAFAVESYDDKHITEAFSDIKKHWPNEELRVAVWNAGYGVWKPFLQVTDAEVRESVNTNIVAAFSFSRAVIHAFKDQKLDDKGKRGTLIFTGATASLRGNVVTSAFAAGKHGLRALSQSLAKEFGKQNIHVSHAIIDGGILTDRSAAKGEEWAKNQDGRLDPESIGKSYLYLAEQDRSAWTWELDLRPAHEKW